MTKLIFVTENKLQREPTIRELSNKLVSACNKWYQIGIQLEIENHCLKSISRQKDDDDLCLISVFELWNEQHPSTYTWATIIDVLKHPAVGMERLAREVEEWVISQP